MTRLSALFVLVLAGCVTPPPSASTNADAGAVQIQELSEFMSRNGYAGIEMARLPTGHFSVVGSADEVSLSMIIDTGASHTLIDTGRADRFEMATEEAGGRATGVGSSGQPTERGRLDNVAIGALRLDTLRVTVLDLSNVNRVLRSMGNDPVDGIIGADVLMAQQAVIDYGSLRLYVKE